MSQESQIVRDLDSCSSTLKNYFALIIFLAIFNIFLIAILVYQSQVEQGYESQTANNPLALLVSCVDDKGNQLATPQANTSVTLNYCVNNAPPAGFEIALSQCWYGDQSQMDWFDTIVTYDQLISYGASPDVAAAFAGQTYINMYENWYTNTYIKTCTPTKWAPSLDDPSLPNNNEGTTLGDYIAGCKGVISGQIPPRSKT